MTGTKFWTASIATGVVLTLLVAAAHFTSSDASRTSNRNARLARLQTLLDEGKTEYSASLIRKKIKAGVSHVAERVAGLDDSTVTAVQPAKDTKEAKDDKKVAKKDEKKKKDDKKDKKKKKKKKKKKGAGETEETTPEDSSDEDAEEANETAATGGAAGTNAPTYAGAGVNTNPQTIEEWFAYLQANLDYEHVSKFIQLAQAGEVSTEVFYGTLEKMLETKNTRMQQFAVLALGATPSQESFVMLADVTNTKSMETKVRSQAKTNMNTYARIEYVGYLSGVVGTDAEVGAAISALAYIETAANKHLRTLSSTSSSSVGTPNGTTPGTTTGTIPGTGTGTDETQTNTRSPASNVTRTFETLAASLTAATGSKNAQLSSMSAQTLQLLRSLLGQV